MDEINNGIKLWKILLLLLLIIGVISLIIVKNKPKEKVKVKKELNLTFEDQKVNRLDFEDIKIFSKDGIYYFTARVRNDTYDVIKTSPINIYLDNLTFTGYIGDEIGIDEYKMLTMETKENLSNIKTVKFNFQT